jgi:hypothetical protein
MVISDKFLAWPPLVDQLPTREVLALDWDMRHPAKRIK